MVVEKGNSSYLYSNSTPEPIILPYRGRRRPYVVELYMGDAYEKRRDELLQTVIDLSVRSGRWSSRAVAEEMVRKSIEPPPRGVRNPVSAPSVMLFRRAGSSPKDYIGAARQCRRIIKTQNFGDVPIHHLQGRFILKEDRAEGLGSYAVQQGRALYTDTRFLGVRSESAVANYSTLKAGVSVENPTGIFRENCRFSFDRKYDEYSLTGDSALIQEVKLAQELMLGFWNQIKYNGRTIDLSTGVSAFDYPEPNLVAQPRIGHKPTEELAEKQRQLGVGPASPLYGIHFYR